MKIKIVNKSDFDLPKYETLGSVGMDIRADLKRYEFKERVKHIQRGSGYSVEDGLSLLPGDIYIIPTGLFVSIGNDYDKDWLYELQIRPRSGLAAKYGITVVNSPGTIDQDYRGEIKVIIMNLSSNLYKVQHGDRIAQMVLNKVSRIEFDEVDNLDDTIRGDGGFGHTGS